MFCENGTNCLPVIISIASAAIAAISAIIALCNAHSARKSYKIQKSISDAGKPSFEVSDVTDCFLVDDKKEETIKYIFFVVFKNFSDKPTSIPKIRLRLRFNDSDVFLTPINLGNDIGQSDFTKEPINLSQRSSIQCKLGFSLPKEIYDESIINSYAIVAEDIDQNERIKGIIYVREVLINYELKE